jgi:hypothetical protein
MAVRLSDLRTGRPLPLKKIPDTHFCSKMSRSQGHSAAGRIWSIEKSNDLFGNRTRDTPARSVVPQPTTLPRAPDGSEWWVWNFGRLIHERDFWYQLGPVLDYPRASVGRGCVKKSSYSAKNRTSHAAHSHFTEVRHLTTTTIIIKLKLSL